MRRLVKKKIAVSFGYHKVLHVGVPIVKFLAVASSDIFVQNQRQFSRKTVSKIEPCTIYIETFCTLYNMAQ